MTNLAVLAVLAAIGWWGHATHWSFISLGDTAPENAALTSLNAGHTPRDASPILLDHLPAIEFATADAAYNCGIMTGRAEQQSMDDVVTASGVVGYDQTHLAQLAVRVPGIVWRVEKRVGDAVRPGDVLVIVDSAEVGDAKAALLEAAVVFNLKTQNLERLEKLEDVLAVRELREAQAAREVSRAQRFNAVQKLANLGFPLHLEDIANLSGDELAHYLHLLGLPKSLERETASANLIPLVAPFAGVVTTCEVVRGEAVTPSTTQYVVADIARMWINLDVRQEDSTRLRIGTEVDFSAEGDLRPVRGALTWIGTEIDPRTRTIKARAEVVNPPLDATQTDPLSRRLLQVNAFGTAQVVVSRQPATIVVPDEALHWQWEIGREIVFVTDGEGRRFEPRVVRKGMVRGSYAQVLEGLNAGERVVTSGSRILSSELSERLQRQLGDNADADRSFSGTSSSTPMAQAE